MTDKPRSKAIAPSEAFEERVRRQTQIGNKRVTFQSRGRKYTFYWYKAAHRLAVKVHPLPPRNREVEGLAATLKPLWTCPLCHVTFERKGKQKFCTKAHAATFRKRQWLRRQRDAATLKGMLAASPELARRAREAAQYLPS
jgi:hypothetical protein